MKSYSPEADSGRTSERIPFDLAAANEAAKRIQPLFSKQQLTLSSAGFRAYYVELPLSESRRFFINLQNRLFNCSAYTEDPLLNGFISDET